MKTAARNGKHGYRFGKRSVLRFNLTKSRKGFCQTGRGRWLHVVGSKTEKAWESTRESLVQGTWRLRLRVLEAEGRILEGVLKTVTLTQSQLVCLPSWVGGLLSTNSGLVEGNCFGSYISSWLQRKQAKSLLYCLLQHCVKLQTIAAIQVSILAQLQFWISLCF